MQGKYKINTQKADREFWIWLAGFFDGEDTVLVSKYTRTRDGRSEYTKEEIENFRKIREINSIHGRSRYDPSKMDQ